MSKNIVTLYVDDTSIRLLVTDSKRIKKWADLPLEPGLIENAVIIKEAEVAAKIKQLLKAQKVRAKKVIVGLSGLHCFTRPITLPQLPKAMLAEAVTREANRLLPLPLNQLYLIWQTIPTPEDNTQVFLTAVRRKSADALFKTFRQTGLNPYLIDIKSLALARLVKESTAVIVDTQPTEFDIVIMADGIPQPIRTVPFPQETLTWQEKFALIRNDLDRTIQFYNSNNKEKPLPHSTPIFVSGELASETELNQSLSNELGYPVMPLSSPLECPEQLDLSRYIVNIGLALKESSLGKKAGPSVANLNLLPIAYRPKPISWAKVIAVSGAIAITGLLIPMVMLVQSVSADIDSMSSQLSTANHLITQKQLQRQEMRNHIAEVEEELEKQLTEAEASRDAFAIALKSLDKEHSAVNGDLFEALPNTPMDAITLTNISRAGNILTISGTAPSETEVLSYARRLDASGRFSETIIARIQKTEDEGMDFSLVLKARG